MSENLNVRKLYMKYSGFPFQNNLSWNFSISIFLKFMADIEVLNQKTIKQKIILMLIYSNRFIGFNFEKIKNIFEITKILELQTNKIYPGIKNKFFKKKEKRKFTDSSFYDSSKNFLIERNKKFSPPIPISILNSKLKCLKSKT